MKVLLNASTTTIGGGTQVSTSLVTEALKNESSDIEFYFVLHQKVANNLPELAEFRNNVSIVKKSPARIVSGHPTRVLLKSIEKQFEPDVVLTVFGPSYVTFRSTHVCGIADGWVTHPSRAAQAVYPPASRIIRRILSVYKSLWFRTADYFWVEADVARRGFSERTGISVSRIAVIPNTYARVFEDYKSTDQRDQRTVKRIFTIGAPHPHKNYGIIPDVAAELRRRYPDEEYVFVVTLPEDNEITREIHRKTANLGVTRMIDNIGPIPLSSCPNEYDRSDAVFLPTLLETFSATYPEAMYMRRPIVTTDFDFARDVCGGAALYFRHDSPEDAAEKLHDALFKPDITEQLIENGKRQVAMLPTPSDKFNKLMDFLKNAMTRDASVPSNEKFGT